MGIPIITLTSDWGVRDHYLASVKGTLFSKLPGATIVDISHEIEAFNLKQASFVLRNSFSSFPEGTIHIIAIQTVESKEQAHAIVFYKGHIFIGTDSGIFSLIFDEEPDKIINLDIPMESDYYTFAGRDRFVKAAVHLAEGGDPAELGPAMTTLHKQLHFKPVISENVIRGMVIYIDHYQNVITNITEKIFKETGKGRPFTIECRGEQIRKISKSYSDVHTGEIVALFGSTANLEIAMNLGPASSLLGLFPDSPVSIIFED